MAGAGAPATRERREAEALRANLHRRKLQSRLRAAQGDSADPNEGG